MGRKPPSNLSKVDYNEGMETLFTVLDARILDCFRLHWDTSDLFTYFAKRAEKTLPSLGELEDVALSLYRAYSTSRGYERAMHAQSDCDRKTMLPSNLNPTPDGPVDKPTPWEKTVPIGTRWTPLTAATSSRSSELQQAVQSAAGEESALSEPDEFQGDRALAQSIALMRDAVVLREFVLATCEGDVGRMRL
ncbi:uncharacterized protein C8Q71DRAFT_855905 [Rhodofomes roseus]|uniref:DUF6589 domain-containing protein n=1 Tax=Rhodofomes roseus TaxID=34475 RepID=A0ABQ8KM47_9APHY|nr:uncharacterized protein C8Q71DRAFT_855905 [Rhodofomes roseus]KAH9839276.1 hypothetical protein C8Q71DRAFT_855905 [Rhodofomes roseus]